MPSFAERILEALSSPAYRPVDDRALARALGLRKTQLRTFAHELRLLAAAGRIRFVQGDRLALAEAPDAGLVVGRISFRQSGHALVTPDRRVSEAGPAPDPIFIPAEDTDVALHGDRVAVRVDPRSGGGRIAGGGAFGGERERRGRVVRVVESARDTVVGHLRRARQSFYVSPDDPRFVHDIAVPPPLGSDGKALAEPGDKVVVRLKPWTARHQIPEGRVIERLGRTFEPRAELAGVYRRYDLHPEFPDAVLREVADLPGTVGPNDSAGREDFRALPVFTIDPDDAKDFDDALSIEEMPRGDLRVGVHIADVSTYVRPGTALDREAQRRGNSTYLVGTVVPMLPEKLSNGLCSLVEGEDRLCKAVLLTFDRKGRLKDTRFADTVIRSRKRLTYRQAYALLFTDDLGAVRALPLPSKHQTGSTGRALSSLPDPELAELQGWVRKLWSVARRLRAERMAHGSLDLDMPETKIFVDAEGYAERLERVEHDESHQLIEEFMLAANEAVARHTREHRLPSLYRVHDEPDAEKLAELRETLVGFGVRTGDLARREEVVRLLATLAEHPQGYSLRTQLLRSLRKAVYRASPDGHYGLHKRDYTHFTSPIRRYADLVVHRVLGPVSGPAHDAARRRRGLPGQGDLESLGEHLSLAETNSQEAERESQKIKLAEFFERELQRKPRTRFAAIVTDVRNHGLFVELVDSMTFGAIALAALDDDHYLPTPDGRALVGRRTRRRLGIGDRLDVVVAAVDRFKRQIDFRPA